MNRQKSAGIAIIWIISGILITAIVALFIYGVVNRPPNRHVGDGTGDALVAARYPRCVLSRDAVFGGLGAGEAGAADHAGAAPKLKRGW